MTKTSKSTTTTTKAPTTTASSSTSSAALACSISALVCALGACGYCIYDFYNDHQSGAVITYSEGGNSATFTDGSIASIASKVSPAVVSISVSFESTNFFGQTSTATGGGTGMIVSSDGYIITNKHVIADATDVNIITADGKTYQDITLIGEDPLNDVAFLKIKDLDTALPTVTLGDSKTLSVGQQVLAVGNALGEYQNTVTSGIISGIGRSVTATSSDYSSVESLSDMVQTDAAINAGNSGGPLVNAAGEVIGINTATTSGGEAISFAIPISSVKGMLSEILATGKAARAYIGVRYISITPSVASTHNLPVSYGAYAHASGGTSAIVPGGPADAAGLQNEDIITAVNGTKVTTGSSLSTLIGEYRPGDRIVLTVLRSGEEITLTAVLGEYHE